MKVNLARHVLFFAPILVLFALGLVLALRSGVRRMLSGDGVRQVAGNLSQVIILLVFCMIAVAAVQQWIGVHFTFGH
jgi:hypothetical protein